MKTAQVWRVAAGATVFLSAFLLFLVQPVIARVILPWFGGSPAVWATCLLFFQSVLFLGYCYAHLLDRWAPPRWQTLVHLALLGGSLALLPLAPKPGASHAGGEAMAVLALLMASVGLPYLLLSSTTPLAQAWYARIARRGLPYRLFAVSNLASLAALLGYPVLIEPLLPTARQLMAWSGGYAAFALICGALAWQANRPLRLPDPDPNEPPGEPLPPVARATLAFWLILPACASMLLLSVSTHMTQNVAPVPFLWVLPLGLYLLSFVVAFGRTDWYPAENVRLMLIPSITALVGFWAFETNHMSLKLTVPVLCGALFFAAWFCHGELAARKPAAGHLTLFYLMVALGGALGGIVAGLIAPRVFPQPVELPLSALLCAFLGLFVSIRLPVLPWWAWALAGALGAGFLVDLATRDSGARYQARNFFGTIQVREVAGSGPEDAVLKLLNGTISHGEQFLDPERRREPTTYYGPYSGAGLVLRHCGPDTKRVGVIGLGAGTLATYAAPGDYYRFYEINPLVIEVARTHFTFLADSEAETDVVLGDARLSLEREPPQRFDVIVLDAFSGDSIPVHLLTLEAFGIYLQHLAPGGVVAAHVSNVYLDLAPLVWEAAKALGQPARLVENGSDSYHHINASTWVLMGGEECLATPGVAASSEQLESGRKIRLWTDDSTSLLPLLK